MTTKTELRHDGGFLMSEANGHRSRGEVTLLSGQNLVAGTVLGKVTATGKYKAFDNDAGDGTETAAGVLLNGTNGALTVDTAVAIIARDAEVNGHEIFWPATEDAADIAAGVTELATLGIIVRN